MTAKGREGKKKKRGERKFCGRKKKKKG